MRARRTTPSPAHRLLERKEGGEHLDAAHEVVGRVDRVDDPAAVSRVRRRTELLADDGVRRVGIRDSLAEARLDLGVGLGDERLVVLRGDRQLAREVAEGDPIRLVEPLVGDPQEE